MKIHEHPEKSAFFIGKGRSFTIPAKKLDRPLGATTCPRRFGPAPGNAPHTCAFGRAARRHAQGARDENGRRMGDIYYIILYIKYIILYCIILYYITL
jgi:hypothetical protein